MFFFQLSCDNYKYGSLRHSDFSAAITGQEMEPVSKRNKMLKLFLGKRLKKGRPFLFFFRKCTTISGEHPGADLQQFFEITAELPSTLPSDFMSLAFGGPLHLFTACMNIVGKIGFVEIDREDPVEQFGSLFQRGCVALSGQ